MSDLWQKTESYPSGYHPDVDEGWQRFKQKMSKEDKQSRAPRVLWTLLKVAAVLVVGVGITWSLVKVLQPSQEWIMVQTLPDETRRVELPDGSVVVLNDDSWIAYANTGEKRLVHFGGQAFFEVAHLSGKPFEISIQDDQESGAKAKVVVLGTSFQIHAQSGKPQVEVEVESGKVLLTGTMGKAEKTLQTNEKGKLQANGEISVENIPAGTKIARWKSKIRFQNKPLLEVSTFIREYYGVQVEVENTEVQQCNITIRVDTDSSALDAVNRMAEIINAKVEGRIGKEHFVISGGKCPRLQN